MTIPAATDATHAAILREAARIIHVRSRHPNGFWTLTICRVLSRHASALERRGGTA